MTIGERLDLRRGYAPGFDAARVMLAISIVAFHSCYVVATKPEVATARWSWFIIASIVPAFFALSGFLITGSAHRLTIRDYVVNRSIRIMPGLTVEIVGSALLLGAIFTTLPLAQYFSDPLTWRYFTNLIFIFNYSLPGVFENLPSSGVVNISLWTVPWELLCYTLMLSLMATRLIVHPLAVALPIAAYFALGVPVQLLGLHGDWSAKARLAEFVFFSGGSKLVLYFLGGVLGHQLRRRIPYDWRLFCAAILACVAIAAFAPIGSGFTPIVAMLGWAPLVYITLFIGVSDVPKLPFFSRGDYSYGIYLYGYPIQQSVKAVFPGITSAAVITLVALPLIILLAVFSWHVVEKPALRLRRTLVRHAPAPTPAPASALSAEPTAQDLRPAIEPIPATAARAPPRTLVPETTASG